MKIVTCVDSITELKADAVAVGILEDGTFTNAARQVDEATGGVLKRLLASKDISGKQGDVTSVLAPAGLAAGQVVVAGLGKPNDLDVGVAFRVSAAVAKHLAGKARDRVAYYLADGPGGPSYADGWTAEQLQAGVAGSMTGCRGQGIYQAEPKLKAPAEILWRVDDPASLQRGVILGEGIECTRRLVNEPPNQIFPESFTQRASEIAQEVGLQIEVWDQPRLEQERCGSLLAVARGSTRPPRLVILRHQGGQQSDVPLALVGKGVTFDSGGLSLKPNDSMQTMKCDMAGAATVVGAMRAIAQLKLPLNVIGLVGLVENMPGAAAYKLGDVLTARNGKTIEVLNTDAEGRLVLADVLAVAVDRGAARIIDLATLTGACMVALGADVAGLMSNDDQWCATVAAAAGRCGERAWQLPMFAEYGELIKSEVAEIRNTGQNRYGGAITAAKFLEHFVGQTPWVHFDIAGPAFFESSKPWIDAGGTGAFVRTLVEVARELSEKSGTR